MTFNTESLKGSLQNSPSDRKKKSKKNKLENNDLNTEFPGETKNNFPEC